DRLDVVLHPGGDQHHRARADLARLVADVVDRASLRDQGDLVEVVAVRAHLHPRLAVVQDEHRVARAEGAAADAGADRLVGDLVPGVGGHQALLSSADSKPSSAESRSAASRSRSASSESCVPGRFAIVPTTAIAATTLRSWNTGVAIARIPSTVCVLIAIRVSRTRASSSG